MFRLFTEGPVTRARARALARARQGVCVPPPQPSDGGTESSDEEESFVPLYKRAKEQRRSERFGPRKKITWGHGLPRSSVLAVVMGVAEIVHPEPGHKIRPAAVLRARDLIRRALLCHKNDVAIKQARRLLRSSGIEAAEARLEAKVPGRIPTMDWNMLFDEAWPAGVGGQFSDFAVDAVLATKRY